MNGNEMRGLQQLQAYGVYEKPKSPNAIEYLRERRRDLSLKLVEAEAWRKEAEQIDLALAALEPPP